MSGNIFNFANGNKVLRLGFPHRHLIENGFMDNIIEEVTGSEYKYGFVTNVETDTIAKGLSEEVIRTISAKKGEPEWLLEFRLKAYRKWLGMKMPQWAHLDIPAIDYQDIVYYAAPKQKGGKDWKDVDPADSNSTQTSWNRRSSTFCMGANHDEQENT